MSYSGAVRLTEYELSYYNDSTRNLNANIEVEVLRLKI